jgi:hypothetical protein
MIIPVYAPLKTAVVLLATAFCVTGVLAQTAEELIAKNIAAKGGLESIKAITSRRSVGKVESQGIIVQVGADQKPEFMTRQVETLQRMTRITAYDGAEGWRIDPFQGRRDPERLGEEDARNLYETYDFYGPLVDYDKKGSRVEYIGHEPVDGDDTFLLKITLKNGDIIKEFLDPDTFLEIRTERLMFVRGKVRQTFSNLGSYKRVNGVYFPFSIERGTPGDPADDEKITISSIEVNIPMPDSEFKMPEAPSSPAHKNDPPAAPSK